MKKTLLSFVLVFVCGAAMAANVVLGIASNLTWVAAGTKNVVASWASAPAPWTPTYAIQMNVTNGTQYTDSGLFVQENWSVNALINVRSNNASSHFSGVALTPYGYFYFGTTTTPTWRMKYGTGTGNSASGPSTGWHFIQIATTNLLANLWTNGVVAATCTASTLTTNTTVTFYVGSVSVAGNSCNWDVARIQLIDNLGVLRSDLQAQSNGTFKDAVTQNTFNFGVSGSGGTSLDSTNVAGQVPSSVLSVMTFK